MTLEAELDAVIERLLELSPAERQAFVNRFGRAARAAGVSASDAGEAMLELARRLATPALDGFEWARDCRAAPRLVLERCDPLELVTNWRELVLRAAARRPCGFEPSHSADLFCADGLKFSGAAPF